MDRFFWIEWVGANYAQMLRHRDALRIAVNHCRHPCAHCS
jgi:hypothetical protein